MRISPAALSVCFLLAACQDEPPETLAPTDTADRLGNGERRQLSYSISARLSSNGDLLSFFTDYPPEGDRYLFVSADPPTQIKRLSGRRGTVALGARAVYAEAARVTAWAGLFSAPEGADIDQGALRAAGTASVTENGEQLVASIWLDALGNPSSVWIAAATYGTSTSGGLLLQDPVGNGDGNIDANEFIQLELPQH
jgi:hypothetical protein